jgi:hypothetical protein
MSTIYVFANGIGIRYPFLNTGSKVHIFKSICLPTLTYEIHYININVKNLHQLESTEVELSNKCVV